MRYTISLVQKIDSFNELVERIKRHKSIMIGEDADPKKEFTLVAIFDEKCNSNVLHIGVISEDHGLKPQCAINNGNCIIGVNDEVHIIFLETKINITRKLSSLFYEFIETEHFIVIVCELDVYVFDRDCKRDSLGRVTAVTDALGNREAFSYDMAGRITSVTDKNGRTTRYAYDANGNVVEAKDASGVISTFAYDGLNRLVKAATPSGAATLYSYDGRG